ncbi:16703_t:CDS:2, partial [Rhizophagus irregularis]
NLALGYTSCTQQVLINLNNSITVAETWEAIYSIVFNPLEELYHISETALTTDTDSSTNSFDTPNDFRPLFNGGITSKIIFNDEDLNLNQLFSKPEPVELLFADEDLHLNQLFEKPEVPRMAALGGRFNPNILLNALNNLTNALGVGKNNWVNVNNAVNTLNAILVANNNALQTCETQAAQILSDLLWRKSRSNRLSRLKGVAVVWYQMVARNPINVWDGAANNNTFEYVFKQCFRTLALVELWSTKLDQQ